MITIKKRLGPIRKGILMSLLISTAGISYLHAAEQAETERLIRRMPPPRPAVEEEAKKEEELYVDAYYEQSDILQGTRTGHWSELTNLFGYRHRNIQGYLSFSELERFDARDYTANLGYYFNFIDSYAHMEAGFGWDVDYIYKLQTVAEYGHRIVKGLYGQIGYTYRAYDAGDTHIVYPGLIYYFGNHSISAEYGASFIEDRDTAQFGTIRGSFAITDFLRLISGMAFGERLYDINGLAARKEFGYILFAGLNLKLYKGLSARAGYSYSTEEPKFIKRSLNFGLSCRF